MGRNGYRSWDDGPIYLPTRTTGPPTDRNDEEQTVAGTTGMGLTDPDVGS